MKFLEKLEPGAYTALRIVAGFMFLFHGTQKLFAFPAGKVVERFSQAWLGGVIEVVAGLMIMLGLFSRPAAFIASGTMAVAYIQFHWKGAFEAWKWLPIVNKGEMAVLYCFIFLLIAARGPGRFSVTPRS